MLASSLSLGFSLSSSLARRSVAADRIAGSPVGRSLPAANTARPETSKKRSTVLWTLGLGLLLCGTACAGPSGPTDSRPSAAGTRAERMPGQLEIQLHFGEPADLDLFVTDPDAETVYFGNNPSRGGGQLDADLRCDAGPERVETIRFARPDPGRYRVGVEYNRSCRFRRSPAPYRVEIRGDALQLEREGEISPGRFEPIVLEFEYDPQPAVAD